MHKSEGNSTSDRGGSSSHEAGKSHENGGHEGGNASSGKQETSGGKERSKSHESAGGKDGNTGSGDKQGKERNERGDRGARGSHREREGSKNFDSKDKGGKEHQVNSERNSSHDQKNNAVGLGENKSSPKDVNKERSTQERPTIETPQRDTETSSEVSHGDNTGPVKENKSNQNLTPEPSPTSGSENSAPKATDINSARAYVDGKNYSNVIQDGDKLSASKEDQTGKHTFEYKTENGQSVITEKFIGNNGTGWIEREKVKDRNSFSRERINVKVGDPNMMESGSSYKSSFETQGISYKGEPIGSSDSPEKQTSTDRKFSPKDTLKTPDKSSSPQPEKHVREGTKNENSNKNNSDSKPSNSERPSRRKEIDVNSSERKETQAFDSKNSTVETNSSPGYKHLIGGAISFGFALAGLAASGPAAMTLGAIGLSAAIVEAGLGLSQTYFNGSVSPAADKSIEMMAPFGFAQGFIELFDGKAFDSWYDWTTPNNWDDYLGWEEWLTKEAVFSLIEQDEEARRKSYIYERTGSADF